jgi:Xaa-Pro aminopeptidase
MTESEIEQLMVCHMVSLGGRAPWTLITSGPGNYDLVSKGGSSRKVEPGDMIWMDGGCSVDGYFSDFSRGAVLGGPSKAQEEAQFELHRITWLGVEMMRPGVPVSEIAARCNEAVRSLDLPITSNISELAARVGHGLGMVVTEPPSISEEDPSRIQAGMILTIEPGVATSFGTFHIEENVLITEAGPKVLTDGHWQLWKI